MKLRPVLMMAAGPPGIWLIDEHGKTQVTISIHAYLGVTPSRRSLEQIAALIAEQWPDDGIEIPE